MARLCPRHSSPGSKHPQRLAAHTSSSRQFCANQGIPQKNPRWAREPTNHPQGRGEGGGFTREATFRMAVTSSGVLSTQPPPPRPLGNMAVDHYNPGALERHVGRVKPRVISARPPARRKVTNRPLVLAGRAGDDTRAVLIHPSRFAPCRLPPGCHLQRQPSPEGGGGTHPYAHASDLPRQSPHLSGMNATSPEICVPENRPKSYAAPNPLGWPNQIDQARAA